MGFLQGKVQVLILVKTKLVIARALVNSTRTGVGLVKFFFRRERNVHGLLGPPLTRALVISLRGALINFFLGPPVFSRCFYEVYITRLHGNTQKKLCDTLW